MLELQTKIDPKERKGIYAYSVPAGRKDIPLANEMVEYCDSQIGEWDSKYGLKYWAMAHAQLTDDERPKRIFIVNKELFDTAEPATDTKFPSRTIFNARILELDKAFTKTKKVQKTVWKPEKERRELEMVDETYEVPNLMSCKEGCMSFPHRKPKNVDRVFKLKVAYSYPVTILGFTFLWPKSEWVQGLKAQIFQHEIQHFEGENIYYQKEKQEVTIEQKVMA